MIVYEIRHVVQLLYAKELKKPALYKNPRILKTEIYTDNVLAQAVR